jgi:hypothetical protein
VKMECNALSFVEAARLSMVVHSAIVLLGIDHPDSTIYQTSTNLRYALMRIFQNV